jgi:hypothetical protein
MASKNKPAKATKAEAKAADVDVAQEVEEVDPSEIVAGLYQNASEKLDETVEGGAYVVNGRAVNASGEELE